LQVEKISPSTSGRGLFFMGVSPARIEAAFIGGEMAKQQLTLSAEPVISRGTHGRVSLRV
jgi:hypothetical protein